MKRIVALLSLTLLVVVGCSLWRIRERTEIMPSLITEHNQIRSTHDLGTLEIDPRLSAAAQKHATHLATIDRLTHYGEGGTRPSNRIKEQGYSYYLVAENIAAGFHDVDSLMEAWMLSPGHRKNIVGDYVHIGVGAATSLTGRTYWCVLFAVPTPSSL